MGQLPITSRIKRTALLKKSVAKQTEETPKASIVGKGKNTTKIITTPGVAGTENYDAAVAAEGTKQVDPDKITPEMTARANKKRAEAKAADAAAAKPIEKEVVVKGDDVIAPTYTKREGKVQTNFEGRQIGRATKFKNRYVRQSKNKLARADDRMAKFQKKYTKDGVFTAPKAGDKGYKKYKRLEARQTENTNELADFESAAANQAEAVRSGKGINSKTRMDEDRRDTAGDQTPEERKAQVRAENAAKNSIVTESSGQADNAVGIPGETESSKSQFDVGPLEVTKFGEYTATTSPASPASKRGYAMKGKSPATKKLQGNQGRLPQQLQDAIKSAPEGSPAQLGPLAAIAGKALIGAAINKVASSSKMRSGFKMKGYTKK